MRRKSCRRRRSIAVTLCDYDWSGFHNTCYQGNNNGNEEGEDNELPDVQISPGGVTWIKTKRKRNEDDDIGKHKLQKLN